MSVIGVYVSKKRKEITIPHSPGRFPPHRRTDLYCSYRQWSSLPGTQSHLRTCQERRMGWGKKEKVERPTLFYPQFISLSKTEYKMKKRSNIESVAETPGTNRAEEGGEESKWAGGSIRLEKKGDKSRGCGASSKDGKNRGSEGNGRTKAGRGGGKEEADSITREKKESQRRRNAGEAWNKRGNIKVRRTGARTQVSGVDRPGTIVLLSAWTCQTFHVMPIFPAFLSLRLYEPTPPLLWCEKKKKHSRLISRSGVELLHGRIGKRWHRRCVWEWSTMAREREGEGEGERHRHKERERERGSYCLLYASCWRLSSQSSSDPSWMGRTRGHSTETDRRRASVREYKYIWPLGAAIEQIYEPQFDCVRRRGPSLCTTPNAFTRQA